MNKIEELFKKDTSLRKFASGYFAYLYELLNSLDISELERFVTLMEEARGNGNTIFFAGNGGSGATASHMANDFGTDIRKKGGSEIPFRALALTDNNAVMLAIANDDGFENLFVNQLRIHYRPGDILVVISASGNSENLVNAAKWMRERDAKVASLVGFDGGQLKDISDVCIHVQSNKGEYGPVEDVHMVLDHLLANYLQCKVQEESKK